MLNKRATDRRRVRGRSDSTAGPAANRARRSARTTGRPGLPETAAGRRVLSDRDLAAPMARDPQCTLSRGAAQAGGPSSAAVRSASRCALSKWGVRRLLVMAKDVPVVASAQT